MKSKGSSASKAAISALHMYNNPQMKTQNTHRTNMVADEKESTKTRSSAINRNNPWNVDPFMPHYKKQPAVFPVNDEAVKSDQAKVSKVQLSGLPHSKLHLCNFGCRCTALIFAPISRTFYQSEKNAIRLAYLAEGL